MMPSTVICSNRVFAARRHMRRLTLLAPKQAQAGGVNHRIDPHHCGLRIGDLTRDCHLRQHGARFRRSALRPQLSAAVPGKRSEAHQLVFGDCAIRLPSAAAPALSHTDLYKEQKVGLIQSLQPDNLTMATTLVPGENFLLFTISATPSMPASKGYSEASG